VIQASNASALRGGGREKRRLCVRLQWLVVGVALSLALANSLVSPANAEQMFSRAHSPLSERVDTGDNYNCKILGDGAVRCWGLNTNGQLGYGHTEDVGDNETPGSLETVDLGAGRTAVAISAGRSHTCAILDNGAVRCWGANEAGQLGLGNTTQIGDNEVPAAASTVDLGLGRTAIAIAAGYSHTCAVLDNGTVRCWGSGESGRLGYGNTTSIGDNESPGSVAPVNLGLGRTAVAISTGYNYSCAILDDGSVRCWGANEFGQLGYGNKTTIGDNEAPGSVSPVDLGAGRTAVSIAAGNIFTCAVLDNGTVRCWGNSFSGQLGYGNTNTIGDNETPGSVGPVDIGGGRNAVTIATGGSHACALLDNGSVRCWGSGVSGRLGAGNTNTIGDNETPGSVPPLDLGAGRNAVAVKVGAGHSCATLDNGTVRCWGLGSVGQLGYGNTANVGDNETPGSVGVVALGSAHGAIAVSAGFTHSCAVLDTGAVRCWGSGSNGRLGYGNTTTIGDNETPSSAGPVDLDGRGAVDVVVGDSHSCALLDIGAVKCWGNGANGRLGYGDTATIGDNETPDSVGYVQLGRSAVAIAAGSIHTCALLDNGTVRCWGSGLSGRLGYGNTASIGDDEAPDEVAPVNLGAGRTAMAISSGISHTCALLNDGNVRCWGVGFSGQLGYASTANIGDDETPDTVGPVNLGLGRTGIGIAGGGTHTCAPLNDGTVRCWGNAVNGQLGYGNTENIGDNETPGSVGTVDLGLGRTSAALAGGEGHTCALLNDGTIRCWGANNSGQLGYGNTTYIGDNELPGSAGPVDLGLRDTAVAVTVGNVHTCALQTDGAVRCWGLNSNGQLGYANTQSIGDNEAPGSAGPVDLFDDPPVAMNDATTITEDAAATAIDVLANDTDVDAGPKTIEAKTDGAHGTVSITGGGSGLTYQAAANYCGPDSFTYTLSGGSQATVSVTITCVDDAPVAVNDSATVSEDASAMAIDVLANDTDVDGGPKGVSSKTDGAHGTVAITGGGSGLTYQPIADYCGPDSFTYTLNGGSSATVSVTITCIDDLPVAVNDSATVAEDAVATSIDVLANDTDVDGGPKSIQSATDPAKGSVSITGGGTGLTYAPDSNYCNQPPGTTLDTFSYELNGGSKGTVSMTVTCVDDAPVAVNDSATLPEDSPATAVAVLANDTDIDGGPMTVVAKTDGSHGAVLITGGGSGLTYAPAANYCGPDSFTYELNGGSSATVSLTVSCVDDAPVAVNDSAIVAEDAAATAIDVLANDTDIDAGPKAIASATDPAHGTVNLSGGSPAAHTGLSYTPDPNYCGADSFTYELTPGGSTATVSITVSCVDDPPVAIDDAANVEEDSSANVIDALANDPDADGGPKSVSAKTDGAHGKAAILGGGLGLSYAPDANYCGPDSFTYTLNGGSTATVSVTIACSDDAPSAADDSATVAEDAPAQSIDVLANDTDVDAGPKQVSSKSNGAHGSVSITGGGSGLSYAPDANYCGPDSFTYTLNGGSSATVSVTITCIDDLPVAVNDSATVTEDAVATSIDVLANDTDVDGGPKGVNSKTDGAHGTVAITGGGSGLAYSPDPNYCGPDSFTYTLNGGSNASVSITVFCVDDAPVAVSDSDTVLEDAPASPIDVLANDTDVDGGPKTIIGRTNGAHGTVAVFGVGAGLTYQPNPDYCGPDSFTYTLSGGSQTTVSISVTCVEDPSPPEQSPGTQTPTIVPVPSGSTQTSSAPVVNITPGIGVVSGRRRPRVAVKGSFAFFTLTCKHSDKDCAGMVTITANVPSVALGPAEKVTLVKGKFRIAAGRSVLVRAKLTRVGLEMLKKRSLRGVGARMAIVDAGNGERGKIEVNLVRRPKASLLPSG
jgi:VCBS repeat-containing protein